MLKKRLTWVVLLPLVVSCSAQNVCSPSTISQAAAPVTALLGELRQIKVENLEELVPPEVADKLTQLKDALSRTSDAALSCAKPSVDPVELQKSLAQVLHANAPEPAVSTSVSKAGQGSGEISGLYGNNLQIQVTRPGSVAGIIEIQYSTGIECGSDTMLLAYELHDGVWTQKLRWQSPALKAISDAFGDFFATAYLPGSSAPESADTHWRVVVAYGRPWCTSRFSHFRIDLLSPGSDPAAPRVLWNTGRGYSRISFDPRLKSAGNTFELRLNDDCMMRFSDDCFERRVIYRYIVDGDDHVRRVGPIAINARGFVEEWLSAPWSESRDFSSAEAVTELQAVYDRFDAPIKLNGDQFVRHPLGPVRACAAPGVFQVQIDSTLENIVPGKPGGVRKPLASRYFHVREVKDGYVMLSAPTAPDPTCSGANLMPAGKQ